MIRISEARTGRKDVTLRLEGRLGAASIAELDATCARLIAAADRVVIDVASVSFLDRAALALLRDLRVRGVTFTNGNAFVTEQLKEVEQP